MKYIILLVIISFVVACTPEDKTETAVKETTDLGVRYFSPVDLYNTKRISDIQLSPDGQWVMFRISTPNIEENNLHASLHCISIDGSEQMTLVFDKYSVSNARWSPDGSKIAYISNRDGSNQIYVQPFPKGNAKKITDIPKGVANIQWSPDGNYFSFTSKVKMFPTLQEEYPEYDKAKVRRYEDLPIRLWDTWMDEYVSHLFIIPSDGGLAKDLMEGEPYDTPLRPYGGVGQIAWSPDSKEITYTCKKVDDFVMSTNSDLYVVNIETMETNNITKNNLGYDYYPAYSSNGEWLAYRSQERPGFEADRVRLMLYNRTSKETIELSNTLDSWVDDYVWSPDNNSIYFYSQDSGSVSLFNISVPDGQWNRVDKGIYDYTGGISITPDGKNIVIGRESMLEPMDIYLVSTETFEPKRLTNLNEKLYENITKCNMEERWFTSTDGAKVHSWIIYPPDFDPNKKYPMITYLQGGPQSMLSQRFHYRWNSYLFASNGYVVLLANRRGVPGFGQAWNDAISLDWGGQAMSDYIAVTDEFSKEPFINEDALCAVGASAGGYAAFWLAAHHEGRFKAFIAHCGVFNFESMYGATEELFFPNWEWGGPYWDAKNKAHYEKHSPHKYVQNWDTPIMITTGEQDYRVPYTQSLEAFTAARAQGIDAKLLIYPEQTHFIALPQEFIIWQTEFFKFLDKYCK